VRELWGVVGAGGDGGEIRCGGVCFVPWRGRVVDSEGWSWLVRDW